MSSPEISAAAGLGCACCPMRDRKVEPGAEQGTASTCTRNSRLPRAPCLLKGYGHPSAISVGTIGHRLCQLPKAAGLRRSDGCPLIVQADDFRRIFASEHLNNNTRVHVIQALLGHTHPDTVMIYAKLYPTTRIACRYPQM